MKKLFIFRKQLTANSVVTDSQGLNLDFLAIPADNLANISARQGEIILSFKDGNDFSDSGLSNSSSTTLRFCNVTIAVVEGKEYSVVQALWNRAYKTADATIVFDNTSDTFFNDNVLRIESIVRSESPAFASSSDVPVGGDIDQVLTKLSSTDGDADWVYPHTLFITVRNVSGGTLQKGTPVHATGVTGNVPDVIAADASNSSAMPATYVLNEQINNNAQGVAIIVGTITGVDTSAFSAGDVVYVASGGGFTNVKPTGTNLIQNLGVVTRSNSTTGSGVVYGSGRSNDVPNLPTGKFFIGSATNTLESAYTLPTADGTSGQVLTTNGAGAVTFQTPSTPTERFVFTGLAAVDTAANERFIPLSAGDVDINTNDIRMAAIVPVDANIEKIAIVSNTATTNTVTVRMYKNYVLASTNSSVSLAANVTQVLTPTATSFTAGDVISVSIEQDPTAVDLNFVNITVSLTT